jgi:hypothetical protein
MVPWFLKTYHAVASAANLKLSAAKNGMFEQNVISCIVQNAREILLDVIINNLSDFFFNHLLFFF